jgi:hypothetical protein
MMTNSKTFCPCYICDLSASCFHFYPHGIVALFFSRYVWESKADGSFAISEDTWNEPLGRGTEIKLHLRDEAKEYLEEDKLKVLPY